MALINYLHIYANGEYNVHVQATGDQFPTGYASGNLDTSEAVVAECAGKLGRHSPSMRPGSSSRYLPCVIQGEDVETVGGEAVCSVAEMVAALRGPSPTYSVSQAAQVAEQVARTVAAGTAQPAQEVPAAGSNKQAVIDQITALLHQLIN